VHPRTKRQKQVLDYITKYVERNGHEPSYQQIARHLGVSSKAGVQRHIMSLENQGLVARKRENGSFTIELRLKSIPTDSVCAVELMEAAEPNNGDAGFRESMTVLPKFMIGSLLPNEVMVFKVVDDSMEEKQICEGDLVVLEKRPYARRGDIALVLINNKQIRLGQFYPQGPQSEIRPANSDFEPLTCAADEMVVQGVMRGLMRPIPKFEE
jgi:repressor LexA